MLVLVLQVIFFSHQFESLEEAGGGEGEGVRGGGVWGCAVFCIPPILYLILISIYSNILIQCSNL